MPRFPLLLLALAVFLAVSIFSDLPPKYASADEVDVKKVFQCLDRDDLKTKLKTEYTPNLRLKYLDSLKKQRQDLLDSVNITTMGEDLIETKPWVQMKIPMSAEERKSQLHLLMIREKEFNQSQVLLATALESMETLIRSNFTSKTAIEDNVRWLRSIQQTALFAEQTYKELIETKKDQSDLAKNAPANNPNQKDESSSKSDEKNTNDNKNGNRGSEPDSAQKNGNVAEQIASKVLQQIGNAADELEAKLLEKPIDPKDKGARFQTVMKLCEADCEDDQASEQADGKSAQNPEGRPYSTMAKHSHPQSTNLATTLVDSESNYFVLTKAMDTTLHFEDMHLLQAILNLIIVAFVCGWICSLLHLPVFFGYVFAGIFLGPNGERSIISVVQVDTLANFGVYLILFSLGLEFSIDHIKKVFRESVWGSILLMVFSAIGISIVGATLHGSISDCILVGASISLSSTAVVLKCLNKDETDSTYGNILMGMLVVQDVILSLMITALHLFAPVAGKSTDYWQLSTALGYMLGWLSVYFLLSYAFSRYILGRLLHSIINGTFFVSDILTAFKSKTNRGDSEHIFVPIITPQMTHDFLMPVHADALPMSHSNPANPANPAPSGPSHELFLLGVVCWIMVMIKGAELFELSMEMGCFVAGIVISSNHRTMVPLIQSRIDPLKDLFVCLFFSSTGLHIYPTFLFREFTILVVSTLILMAFKFLIVFVIIYGLFRHSAISSLKVSVGMAQVSEFVFVIASRSKYMNIISREVYYLLLGTTAISLLLSPLLWNIIKKISPYSGPYRDEQH